MTESEFIKYVAKQANYSIPIVKDLFKVMKQSFEDLMCVGEPVCIINIGKFETVQRKGHVAWDMKTMEQVHISPHYHVKWIQSPALKKKIDEQME